jgi:hypothetical protein
VKNGNRGNRGLALCLMLAGLSSLCLSCAGVKCAVKADRIAHPVSYTPCVYDAKGAIVRATPQQVVGHFKLKKTFWAVLWRNCSLTAPEWDISDDLTREVGAVQGNAVVNMTVFSQGDWWWYASSLLPVLPDYHTVVVEGDVARFPASAAGRQGGVQ